MKNNEYKIDFVQDEHYGVVRIEGRDADIILNRFGGVRGIMSGLKVPPEYFGSEEEKIAGVESLKITQRIPPTQ